MTRLIKISLIASLCSVLIAGISIANALSMDILPTDSFKAVESKIDFNDNRDAYLTFANMNKEEYLALYVGKRRPQMCADYRESNVYGVTNNDGKFKIDLPSNIRLKKALKSHSCVIIKNNYII